jgi:hypothetical protein
VVLSDETESTVITESATTAGAGSVITLEERLRDGDEVVVDTYFNGDGQIFETYSNNNHTRAVFRFNNPLIGQTVSTSSVHTGPVEGDLGQITSSLTGTVGNLVLGLGTIILAVAAGGLAGYAARAAGAGRIAILGAALGGATAAALVGLGAVAVVRQAARPGPPSEAPQALPGPFEIRRPATP